jgi:hypothetical protein
MVYCLFSIRFINDFNNSTQDDLVTIRRNDNGSFQWTYKDHNVNTTPQTATIQSSYEVHQRIESLMRVVGRDDKPVEMIQLDAPGIPSVIFDHMNIESARESIVETFGFCSLAWPVSESCSSCTRLPAAPAAVAAPAAAPAPVSRTRSTSLSLDEDIYADMPDLLPNPITPRKNAWAAGAAAPGAPSKTRRFYEDQHMRSGRWEHWQSPTENAYSRQTDSGAEHTFFE